jgi:hypothetical protein
MSKVTSKYQVTVPRKIAEEYQPAVPQSQESQLHWFDQATERHRKRRAARATERPRGPGGRREDLYGRAALVDTNILVYRFDDRFA